MLNRLFKKSAFVLVESLKKYNNYALHINSMKFFGAKKIVEEISIPKKGKSKEKSQELTKESLKKSKSGHYDKPDLKEKETKEKSFKKTKIEENIPIKKLTEKQKITPIGESRKIRKSTFESKPNHIKEETNIKERKSKKKILERKIPLDKTTEKKLSRGRTKNETPTETDIEQLDLKKISTKKKKQITFEDNLASISDSEIKKPIGKSKKQNREEQKMRSSEDNKGLNTRNSKNQEANTKITEEKISEKPKVNRTLKNKVTSTTNFQLPDLKLGKQTLGYKRPESDLQMYELTHDSVYGIYENYISTYSTSLTKEFIHTEQKFLCNNYAPLPVVLKKGEGVFVKDVDDRIYIDFLSAYSAVNHGHHNTEVIKMMIQQANDLYMTSRAFYTDKLGEAAKLVCEIFEYEKVLFMNGGVEAGESAIKIARRWGYSEKKIPDNQAKIIFAKGNFWGRTTYACATSDDPSRYSGFGPLQTDSHYLVEFNNIEELENLLVQDSNICAVFIEPIQGENGVIIPKKGYLKGVEKLCNKYNVLFVADEIQTGLGRAGNLLYCREDDAKPDIVCLGKSLSAGLYPVSAVLTSVKIMDLIKPGEHGSTYGGNPLASAIIMSSIRNLLSRQLISNSCDMGILLGKRLSELKNSKIVKEIRGRGLMFGIEFHEDIGLSAYHFSLWLMERGILIKPTKQNILRLTPPISIKVEEINTAADIIISVINQAEKLLNDNKERAVPIFDFPFANSELIHKDFSDKMIATSENPTLSFLSKNSLNLSDSNIAEETDVKSMGIIDQLEKAGKTNENNENEFDPLPFLRKNENKIEEKLTEFLYNAEEFPVRLTYLLNQYFDNPLKYESEEMSIEFNKELDEVKPFVATLDIEVLKDFEKRINLTSNIDLENISLYRKIKELINDIRENTENCIINSRI